MLRPQTTSVLRAAARQQHAMVLRRAATTHAISNPTLANIEKRWETMPLQEQADLWMALRDRMKGPWNELTLQEKKAAYWIAFGPHGPRAEVPAGETGRVIFGTFIAVGVSLGLFATVRAFAKPAPQTMNKEWQQAANERLVEQKADPLTGLTSDIYTGTGQIQSPPKA